MGESKPAKANERGKVWRVFPTGMLRFRGWVETQGWRLRLVRGGVFGEVELAGQKNDVHWRHNLHTICGSCSPKHQTHSTHPASCSKFTLKVCEHTSFTPTPKQ